MLTATNKEGWTPLASAAYKTQGPVVRKAIDVVRNGHTIDEERLAALLHQAERNGTSAMHIAVADGRPAVIARLLRNASDQDVVAMIMAKDSDGNTPLHIAGDMQHSYAIEQLLGWLKMCDEQGLPKHWLVKDNEGNTPLHDAAEYDSADVIEELAESMSDATRADVENLPAATSQRSWPDGPATSHCT
jgi:ankyrin repeat protein